jgi:hypothetical protein
MSDEQTGSPRREQSTPPAPGSPSLTHLAAIGAYLLLSLVATWPMVLHFTTEAMGEHLFDRWQNMWNLWWVKVALLDLHTNPFHTPMLFYPQGADLYYHTLSLPSTLITLGPLLLLGIVGAYNTSVLVALVLTGYAGFRLVRYLTGSNGAALLGGIIIGFNPLSLVMLQAQINIVSIQWLVLSIEFYLRAWHDGRRRDMVLLGIWVTLAVLTVGYYEVYLLVFFALHLVWTLATTPGGDAGARVRSVLRRALPVLVWGGGTAALFCGPYLVGALLSLEQGQVVARSDLDVYRTVSHASDLLSFVVPNRDHWLLGGRMPWWQWVNPAIEDYTYLGVIPVALAACAVWWRRRQAWTWDWVVLAGLGVVLALGPTLQFNGARSLNGLEIPLPLSLLQAIPPFALVRSPERFVTLTYIALGVLAGWGIVDFASVRGAQSKLWLLAHFPVEPKAKSQKPKLWLVAGILGLLLLEMPLHARFTEPFVIPPSIGALAREPGPGAVLELPLTQHGWVDSPRMLYQTAYGRPITSGYLSRTIIDPYTQACSPFQVFSRYPRLEAHDIVSPTAASQLPALLMDNGIGFLTVYKWLYTNLHTTEALAPAQLAAFQDLASRLGTPLGDDSTATTYRVQPTLAHASLYLQLGPDWYALEQSYGQPFRWIDGTTADFCVVSPAAQTAPLTFQVASFAAPHHLQVWMNERQVLDALVPADSTLHTVRTPPLAWPVGPQLVRLVAPEGSASPVTLHQGSDTRQLSLGFGPIQLGGGPP